MRANVGLAHLEVSFGPLSVVVNLVPFPMSLLHVLYGYRRGYSSFCGIYVLLSYKQFNPFYVSTSYIVKVSRRWSSIYGMYVLPPLRINHFKWFFLICYTGTYRRRISSIWGKYICSLYRLLRVQPFFISVPQFIYLCYIGMLIYPLLESLEDGPDHRGLLRPCVCV
jgi:hypothetical protein